LEDVRCSIGACILESHIENIRESLRKLDMEVLAIEERLASFEKITEV